MDSLGELTNEMQGTLTRRSIQMGLQVNYKYVLLDCRDLSAHILVL